MRMQGLAAPDTDLWLSLAVALGAGLLIGIERERRKGDGATRDFAGVRTFAMAALMGTVTQSLAQVWLVVVAGLLLVALSAGRYFRERSSDPGITTELALFVTFLLGVHAVSQPRFTAGAAVVVAALLYARGALHRFSTELLSPQELRDALVLAGAALVVLPLVPVTPVSWLGDIDPRRLWALAVLFMAIQALGYLGLRVLGPRLGLALGGLVGGFVSSSATIAALGARVQQTPALLRASIASAWCSCIATALQLAVVATAIDSASLHLLAPHVLTMGATALALSAIGLPHDQPVSAIALPDRAFHLPGSLGFAALLAGCTAGVTWMAGRYGQGSLLASVTLAGFADAHAAAASALSLLAAGTLDVPTTVMAVLLALSANTLSKMLLAFASGGRRYGGLCSAGLALILLAAWLPLAWPN